MYRKLLKEWPTGRRMTEQRYGWWWVVSLATLLGASLYAMVSLKHRLMHNPTFLVHNTKVNDFAYFPSVFVCPEGSTKQRKILNLLSTLEIPPHLNVSYLTRVMPQMSAFIMLNTPFNLRDLENLEDLLDHNGMKVIPTLMALQTNCNETLVRCLWNMGLVECSTLFHFSLTGDGLCCVFNTKTGNGNEDDKKSKKWTTDSFGLYSGLAVVVNNNPIPRRNNRAFKRFAVYTKYHYVEAHAHPKELRPGYERHVGLKITHNRIEHETAYISERDKKCRMSTWPLTHFSIYRRKYCLIECEKERAIKECGCVHYTHSLNNTNFCRAKQLECLRNNKVETDNEDCDCPMTCDLSQGIPSEYEFELNSAATLDPLYAGLDVRKVTVVRVFMNRVSPVIKRIPYYTHIDYVAQIGGVLNIFFGFSFLTVLEILFILFYLIVYYVRKINQLRNISIGSVATDSCGNFTQDEDQSEPSDDCSTDR